MSRATTRARHGALELAVHRLGGPDHGAGLLYLHGLGASAPAGCPPLLAAWPGPIWCVEFAGHGESDIPVGGGYGAEILMADVAAACGDWEPVFLVGAGLGGYVALLYAGTRPASVRGVLILDGPGLVGGGPDDQPMLCVPGARAGPPDILALAELATERRDPAYALEFARAFRAETPDRSLLVGSLAQPSWLAAVVRAGLGEPLDPAAAVQRLAASTRSSAGEGR